MIKSENKLLNNLISFAKSLLHIDVIVNYMEYSDSLWVFLKKDKKNIDYSIIQTKHDIDIIMELNTSNVRGFIVKDFMEKIIISVVEDEFNERSKCNNRPEKNKC